MAKRIKNEQQQIPAPTDAKWRQPDWKNEDEATAQDHGFLPAEGPMVNGDTLVKRLPRDGRPALICPGMVIRNATGCGYGRVIVTTERFCIAEMEDGEVQALPWFQVCVAWAEADPAHILNATPEPIEAEAA